MARLQLGAGQSLYGVKANGTNMVPLVFNACSKRSLMSGQIIGKIVVCMESDEDHSFFFFCP